MNVLDSIFCGVFFSMAKALTRSLATKKKKKKGLRRFSQFKIPSTLISCLKKLPLWRQASQQNVKINMTSTTSNLLERFLLKHQYWSIAFLSNKIVVHVNYLEYSRSKKATSSSFIKTVMLTLKHIWVISFLFHC